MSKKFTFIQDSGESFPEWDEKTLGKILHEPKKEAVSDPSRTELVTVKLYGKGIERTGKFPNKTANARPYYVRNQGELLIGRQNFHNGGMGILPSDLDGLIASNAISSYTLREEVKEQSSMEFIHFLISRKEFYSKVDKLIGGTGQKELSRSEFNKLRIPLPSLAEQQKIAEFFSALDERIALTADKVKLLKEQKTGYLQKVFNRELVFTDANGDTHTEWEQKNLGELGTWGKSYSYSRAFQGEGKLRHIHYGDIHSVYSGLALTSSLPSITIESANHELANDGDVIFADASEDTKDLGKALVLKNDMDEDEPFISGLHTHRFIPDVENLDPYFLLYFTQTSKYYDFMRKYGTGVSVLGISKTNLNFLSLLLPSIPEQKKIAEFFSALDEQIELTGNKLSLLKEQKKGYLQGIFG